MAHNSRQQDFVGTNNDRVWYTGSLVAPTVAPAAGIDTAVLSNGLRYDWNGTAWILVPNVNIPLPSTVIPIADNEVDTAIRTGIVGTSLQYARADHNHPIRRQAIPAQPVVTVGGTGFVLVGTTLNGTVSDEESVTFFMTIQVTQTVSNAWNFFTIPNIAGFQRAEVTPTASYRYTGNPMNDTTNPIDQMYPNAPTMNMEWSYYFNGTAYMNVPNRTQATGYYLSFSVKYTRV